MWFSSLFSWLDAGKPKTAKGKAAKGKKKTAKGKSALGAPTPAKCKPTIVKVRPSLEKSRYLQRYMEVKKTVEKAKVGQALSAVSYKSAAVFLQASLIGATKKDDLKAGALIWSGSSDYQLINKAIIEDDNDQLIKWMPFIRFLNREIVKNTSARELTVYRGSHMPDSEACSVESGMIYRFGMYVATSKKISVAKKFTDHGWIFTMRIPKGCHNAGDISGLSLLKSEAEVLLPPYTAVRVTSVDKEGRRICVEVLDNLSVPASAPTILA